MANHMHDPAHDEGHAPSPFHATLRDYAIGFALSAVLTAVPFWLVISHALASSLATALIVTGFAMAQMVVHMVYFLHMNGKVEGGWTLLALLFTVILLGIAISGSSWVMYHLNANMMPVPGKMDGMG